ncbi:MAG: hypothetical protein FWC43_10930 [Planctomycetaceae bacterium]|nr:hypothetical protein [Planctomycetaceae bacterium]
MPTNSLAGWKPAFPGKKRLCNPPAPPPTLLDLPLCKRYNGTVPPHDNHDFDALYQIMKNTNSLILLLVFLLLFSGCTKKGDDSPENDTSVQQSELSENAVFPPSRDGVLTDDEFLPTEPLEIAPSKTVEADGLKIDTVDPTNYLENGGTFRDTITIGSKEVGFQSTEFSRETVQDHLLLYVVVHNHIKTPSMELSAAHQSFETLQGELVNCQSIIRRNNLQTDQVAQVTEESLEITSTFDGNTTTETLPWKIGSRTGGVCAIQISLLKNPMLDNEERRVSFYDPTRQAIIEAILAAKDVETVKFPDRTLNLRRIETVFKAPQEQIPITFWTDAVGNIVQMSMPFMETETLKTIRDNP